MAQRLQIGNMSLFNFLMLLNINAKKDHLIKAILEN
jgi:hypothetical protein